MRILITGCSGYLGSKVVSLLHAKGGCEIFGIDIKEPPDANLYKKFFRASVTDGTSMNRIFDEVRPNAAIHLAFVVNAMHDESMEEEIDIKGTENFLGECGACKVKKIVFVSSAAAYGAHPESRLPFTESSPVNGNEEYSYSRLKAAADRLASIFMRGYKDGSFVLLRPCLFVGPNTDNSFFEVLKFPIIPQIKDESGIRDPLFQFIHEDDMAGCLAAAIEKDVCGIFNVAADGTVSFSEIAQMAGKKRIALPYRVLYAAAWILWKLHVVGAPPGQLSFMRYSWIMDNSKMKNEIYQPRYSTRDAFREFINKRIGTMV
jgi:UDP-glucose 4-epimerase